MIHIAMIFKIEIFFLLWNKTPRFEIFNKAVVRWKLENIWSRIWKFTWAAYYTSFVRHF